MKWILAFIVFAVVLFLTLGFFSWFSILGGILLFFLVFVRFTLVQEGTAQAVMRLGGFKRIVMAWAGYELDPAWNVVETKKSRPWYGGLRWVGFWPFDEVFPYRFRWRDLQLIEGEEIVVQHDELIDYILVRPDVYPTDIQGAETSPPERIPIDIQFLLTIRVANPYKALFRAPTNWLENSLARLNSLFRDWIATKTYDSLLELRKPENKENKMLWSEFVSDPLISFLKEEWGVEIMDIQIRLFSPGKRYQDSAAEQRQQEFLATARSQAIMGTVLSALIQLRKHGETEREARERILAAYMESPEEFYKKHEPLIEATLSKLAMEEGLYLKVETGGDQGSIMESLLKLIATWKRIPTKSVPPARTTSKKEEPKREEEEIDLFEGLKPEEEEGE